ncbi:MAG: Ig-like domain-containing protein [Gemmatimonadetes bacterium]|nr:Ig-like domain-containing protein [Gemmatimonadota bacterium]
MRFLRWPRRAIALGLAYACLGIVSCDDPLAPDSEEVARIDVNPPLLQAVVGDTRTLTARVVAVDGSILGDRRLYWATQNPGIATVSQSGVVTAVATGNTQIAVSSGGKSAVVPIAVSPRPVTQVRLVPATASVQVGRTVTLRADALDATGAVVAGRTVLWASSAAATATVTSTGVVTGVAAGTATISATVDGISGTAVVTITPIPVASVTVSPGSGSLIVGQTIQLSATTAAAGGQTLSGRVVAWTSSANGVASVSSTGLVTAIAPGSATITATSEGVTGTSTITVAAVPIASIRVTPDAVTVAAGQTVQLTAQALDADGNVLNRPITWSSDLATRATVSATGLVTAVSAGEVRISARSGTAVGVSTVTVTQVPIARIDVAPATVSVLVGGTQQLTATPRDAAGNALPGRGITWLTGAPSVATVSQTGLVTGVASGSALVFAASEGQSGSAAVTVATVAVNSVTISPNTGIIQQGQALQLTATARDASNNVLSGRTVSWTSSDETRATVSSQGRVVAITPGSVTIQATVDGVVGSGTYTITQVPVASMIITPDVATVQTGGTQQLSASLFSANGTPLSTVGRTILWSTSAAGIATVNTSGRVTGVAAGTAVITASSEGVTATATITVSPTAVASVTLAPNAVSLNQGGTQSITATARDAANNVLTGRPVTWTSSNPAVATVGSTTNATNTITAVSAGSATISAVVGGVTGVATVSVSQVPIATITVTGTTSVVEGGTTTLTATARDAANNVLTGRTIVWSSSNPQVSVSQAGVVTAVINSAAQSATITASSPGGGAGGSTPAGTATVSVTFAPVAAVSSTPATATVSVGNTQQLSTILTTGTGQTLNATGRTLTWAALSPTGVATVSASGLVTAVAVGTQVIQVTASSPGQVAPFPTATTTINVNNVPVATVTVAPKAGPNPGTVHVGATYARKFVATVRDGGGNQLTGRSVVWSVSDGTKALITQDGDSTIVTGQAVGAITLTATSEGIPGSIATTVDLVPVSTVSVSPATATLNLFSAPTQQLTAVPQDTASATISGAALGGRTTTWSSSATATATVNGTGLVTGVAAGAATITATVDGVPGTSGITVLAPVSSVALVVAPDSLILAGTLPGTVTLRDASNNLLASRNVTLSSSNTAVATVSPLTATSSGTGTVAFTVTGVGAGSATITASSEGVNQTFAVRMLNPVASVAVAATPDSVIGTSAAPVQATVTLRDAGNAVLTGRPVVWASSAPAVATVNASGLITVVGFGTTSITATSETIVGSLTFRVLPPVNAITFTTPGDSILGTATLLATPDMRDASNAVITGRPITWSSSNTAAATVNSSGLITGVAPGTTTITAAVEGKTATANIRVLAGITSLGLSPATDSIIGMGTLALTAATTPALQGRALTVTSSNAAVATASPGAANTSATGDVPLTITYVAPGTTTLTVSAPAEGRTTTRVLRMLAPVASVSLASAGDSIIGARTLNVAATLRDAGNNVLTGRPVAWSSSNTAVATVNPTTGVVTGVASGTTNITATSEGVTSSALAVRVLPPVATVNVSFTPTTILATDSVLATATLLDAANNPITGRPVTWGVSNTAKATARSTGYIVGVDSGSTNVIATVAFESISGQSALTVNLIPAKTVQVTPANPALQVGQVQNFTATALDSLGRTLTGRAFAWSATNGKITVNPTTGVATAVDSGTVTVTAATSPGTPASPVSGTSTVTITLVPVGTVTLSPNPGTVAVGASINITLTAKTTANLDATSRACTIASADPTKFTVSVASGTTNLSGQLTFAITGVASTGSAPVNVTATCEGVTGTSAITVP